MTTRNNINFTISSNYIGTYNVSIDGILIDSGSYTIDEITVCSPDGYAIFQIFWWKNNGKVEKNYVLLSNQINYSIKIKQHFRYDMVFQLYFFYLKVLKKL